MKGSFTYDQAKAAMKAKGFTVSSGSSWTAEDQKQLQIFLITEGMKVQRNDPPLDPYSLKIANYSFAYDMAPAWLKTVILGSSTPSSSTPAA